MTAVFTLPALRSDDPLGFLAALGLVEVCTSGLGHPVRLGWPDVGEPALFESPLSTLEELAETVHSLVCRWRAEGRLAPPPDPGLILKRLSDAERRALIAELGVKPPNDPMRMGRTMAIRRFHDQRARELAGDRAGARWLVGLVSQLAMVEKSQGDGYCDLTPLYAPAGQQTLYQLYDKYTGDVASDGRWIHEAMAAWRRSPSDSGANLDYRDIKDGTASARGVAENAGVPGATWLALQAVPFFRLVGDGHRGGAVGWQSRRGGRPRELLWPSWQPLLDRAAIQVLLEHPAVRIVRSKGTPLGQLQQVGGGKVDDRGGSALSTLGVQAIFTSARRVGRNSDGPLQAPQVLWP